MANGKRKRGAANQLRTLEDTSKGKVQSNWVQGSDQRSALLNEAHRPRWNMKFKKAPVTAAMQDTEFLGTSIWDTIEEDAMLVETEVESLPRITTGYFGTLREELVNDAHTIEHDIGWETETKPTDRKKNLPGEPISPENYRARDHDGVPYERYLARFNKEKSQKQEQDAADATKRAWEKTPEGRCEMKKDCADWNKMNDEDPRDNPINNAKVFMAMGSRSIVQPTVRKLVVSTSNAQLFPVNGKETKNPYFVMAY